MILVSLDGFVLLSLKMWHYTYITLISLSPYVLSLSSPPEPTSNNDQPEIRAIVLTTAGQIGINPVTQDTGSASDYIGSVGPWSPYLAVQGGSTNVSLTLTFNTAAK